MKKHIIDCDATPVLPYSSWTVEDHQKGGRLKWNPKKVKLWLSDQQKNGYVTGNVLRKEVPNPLNANVLEYLFIHQELIPEEWEGKYVFFWGTIFRDSHGRLCVRYLYWDDGAWRRDYRWLVLDWDVLRPAASLASKSSESKTSALGSSDFDSLESRVAQLENLFNSELLQ